MAKYTLELRELFEPIRFNPPFYSRSEVESWFKDYELSDYLTTEQINVIENNNLWTKDKLAKKIVDHYYMREIGFETPALFKHYAKVTMQEIMERYLPLIYSANINYDPLVIPDDLKDYSDIDVLLTPFALIVPLEWFIYHLSIFNGEDPGSTRHIGKVRY